MLGIILGVLAILGVIVAVVVSTCRTPDHLRGYYGAIVGVVGVAVLGLF